jgi:hypothetical protein
MGSNITGMSAVFGSTGTLTVMATAAQAGVAVYGTGGAAATTLEITTGGSVTLNSGDKNLTLQRAAADTTMLPFNTTIKVLGGGGDDTLNANTGLLHAGEIVAPGGGTNTLVLEGTGFFDLRQPTTLSNIQTVDVEGATPTQGHFIWLRNGLDLTLNMIDAAPAEIFGAVNNDIINLGSGAATVYVGSAGETVRRKRPGHHRRYHGDDRGDAEGRFGQDRAGPARRRGGSDGHNITAIPAVFLDNSASWNVTANAGKGLVFFAGTGTDVITAGDGSQGVFGSTGTLTVKAAAANAGVAVYGVTGSTTTTLEITSGGTVTLNGGDKNLTMKLDAATHLGLDALGFITAIGAAAGGDTLTAGGAGRTRRWRAPAGTTRW